MTYSETVATLLAAFNTIRREYPQIETQSVHAFLTIAARPGITVQEVGQACGLTTASATRNVAYLMEYRSADKPGHGLVSMALDLHDRRVKRLSLTPRGQALVDALSKACTAAQRVAQRKQEA